MSAFDLEALIPKCETIAAWRLAKLLSCSKNHIRHLIEGGSIKVPREELARIKRKEKPWTMASIPRESVIEFIRERVTPAFRQNARQKGAAQ